MKNIHILSTDKPSRLFKDDNQVLNLYTHSILKGIFTNGIGSNQHIYITSDEEIKIRDWVIAIEGIWKNTITKVTGEPVADVWRKIILTTDQDLIKDGVQAIDDEFLEWFVKNPSCEEIEVEKVEFEVDMGLGDSCIEYGNYYKTIIPKEEPKQERMYSEEYMLHFAWFLKENLGQYSCDRTAHFEGKYLEQFKKK